MELQGIEPRLELDPVELYIKGDHTQLQQCLLNLVFNAIEAMPDGGCLTVRGEPADGGDRVCLEIEDTGLGIPPEVMPRIFEPFFTTKGEGYGVGLGLSMVHGIIRQHQGSITVDSQAGRGTVFRVVLPTATADESEDRS